MSDALRTARLVLRQWRDDDAAAFAELSADPAVMQYLAPFADRAAIAAGELPWRAWSELDAVACEIMCQTSPILGDTVRCLTEFPPVHRHSINTAVDIVSRHAAPAMSHGSGSGSTIEYPKRVECIWDISSSVRSGDAD
ncbi:MAG: GNAT family N-acetyltransferase [Stellaceae bacterium]